LQIIKIAILIAITLSTFSLVTCGAPDDESSTSELPSEPTENILVCFGDSLTEGYGAVIQGLPDLTKSYPAFLKTFLEQNGIVIPIVNAGRSGETTGEGLARLQSDVLVYNPEVVIIELGANDLFQFEDVSKTKANLQSMISQLQKNSRRKIYLAKFYTNEVANDMLEEMGMQMGIPIPIPLRQILIKQYNDMFTSLSSTNNVELIEDIWDGVWGINMSDAIHPNAAGYEIMAGNYFKVIKKYFGL
jgi:acyl-CoA thioesterase-1